MESKKCPVCGAEVSETARFCSQCGKEIEPTQQKSAEESLDVASSTSDVVEESHEIAESKKDDAVKAVAQNALEASKPNNPSPLKVMLFGLIGLILFLIVLSKVYEASHNVPNDTPQTASSENVVKVNQEVIAKIAQTFVGRRYGAGTYDEASCVIENTTKGNQYKVHQKFKKDGDDCEYFIFLQYLGGTDSDSNNWEYGDLIVINLTDGEKESFNGTLRKTEQDGGFGNNVNETMAKLPKWKYSQEHDELTNKTAYYASLVSENYVNFDFPYDNKPIYLTLTLRKSPRYGRDVYLTIPEGQFYSSYEYISVRFDDGNVLKYSYSAPSDNSSTCIFINDATGFIKRLKASKQCHISAGFHQEGSPTFTFETKGLKWEH